MEEGNHERSGRGSQGGHCSVGEMEGKGREREGKGKQRLLVRSYVLGGLEARPVPQSGETKDISCYREDMLASGGKAYCRGFPVTTVSQNVPGAPEC